jgi:hypothetical protein
MLYALWCAAIVIKGAAACRMVVTGMIRILPLVCCYVACSFAQLTILLAISPFSSAYLAVYTYSMPFLLAAECAAAASIFWALTWSFSNFRMIGTTILCVLTVAGTGAAWSISFIAPPAHSDKTIAWLWSAALLVMRYVSATTAVVLLSALFLLPRTRGNPIPRIAIHASWIMIFDALMRLAAALYVRSYGFSHPMASAVVPLALGTLAGLGWLTLRKYGETSTAAQAPEDPVAPDGRLTFERESIRGALGDAVSMFQREP